MDKDRKNRLGIPMERTVTRERPGRWMPVVWLLFAVALTVGIIATVQTFVPIDSGDRANVTEADSAEPSPDGAATPPRSAVLTAQPTSPRSAAPTAPAASAAPEDIGPEEIPATAPAANTEAPASGEWVKGDEARLTVRTQAEWREDNRPTGLTYLPPGTTVIIEEVLPEAKYRVHWREATAEVSAQAIAPLDP